MALFIFRGQSGKQRLSIFLAGISLFCYFPALAGAREASCRKLQKAGGLAISFQDCVDFENKIGQLLITHVDGYGELNSPISKGYIDLIKNYQPGGVLLQEGTIKPEVLRATIQTLQGQLDLPLFTAADYLDLESGMVGLGWDADGDELGLHWRHPKECVERKAFLSAVLHKMSGINLAFGPVVEHKHAKNYTESGVFGLVENTENTDRETALRAINEFDDLGVFTTLKHFPYTPTHFNLHKTNRDTRIPSNKVREMIKIFGELSKDAHFVMTTHLFNSQIDSKAIATFSKDWIKILRNELGFEGLIVTDGIFMISENILTKVIGEAWPKEEIKKSDIYAVFAARSILAGHDLVLTEGHSGDFRKIFDGLLKMATSNASFSTELRQRIIESHARIVRFKNQHRQSLLQLPAFDGALFTRISNLIQAENLCAQTSEFETIAKQVKSLNLAPIP